MSDTPVWIELLVGLSLTLLRGNVTKRGCIRFYPLICLAQAEVPVKPFQFFDEFLGRDNSPGTRLGPNGTYKRVFDLIVSRHDKASFDKHCMDKQ